MICFYFVFYRKERLVVNLKHLLASTFGILTLLGPAGGTLCPPCHVMAYNRANTRMSLLKKLDFFQL